MSGALNLTVRNPVDVMVLVARFFACSPQTEMTFEGNISAIDWASIPGAQVREDRVFVVVPLNEGTMETITGSVLPRVGLRSRVWHVVVRRGDQRLFAAYDNFGPGMVVVESPDRQRLRAELEAAGLLIDSRVVMDSQQAAAERPIRWPHPTVTSDEEIVRVCSLGPDGVEVPIYLGEVPSVCRWIAITRVPHRWPDDDDPWKFVIYFLAPDGSEIDFPQRDTLQEALDTASSWSGVADLRWVECSASIAHLQEDDPFPVDLLVALCDSAG